MKVGGGLVGVGGLVGAVMEGGGVVVEIERGCGSGGPWLCGHGAG